MVHKYQYDDIFSINLSEADFDCTSLRISYERTLQYNGYKKFPPKKIKGKD